MTERRFQTFPSNNSFAMSSQCGISVRTSSFFFARPVLDLLFPRYRRYRVRKLLVVDQAIEFVLRGETLHYMTLVFPNPAFYLPRHGTIDHAPAPIATPPH